MTKIHDKWYKLINNVEEANRRYVNELQFFLLASFSYTIN